MNEIKVNELKIFESNEFGEIRTIVKDGEVWFVGKDIAEVLEYSNTNDALISHVDDEDKRIIQKSENATFEIPNRGLQIINESGLYSLILSSKMPKAKEFKRWVTSEVLPSIRKTGSYGIKIPRSFPEALRAYANEVEQRELAEKQRDEAIRTKAWIGSRREATAMNTASIKSKECERLKIELDKSKEYASIRAVEKWAKEKFDWRKLRNYCTAKELEMKKVKDDIYGKINTYPKEAWLRVYGINLEHLF